MIRQLFRPTHFARRRTHACYRTSRRFGAGYNRGKSSIVRRCRYHTRPADLGQCNVIGDDAHGESRPPAGSPSRFPNDQKMHFEGRSAGRVEGLSDAGIKWIRVFRPLPVNCPWRTCSESSRLPLRYFTAAAYDVTIIAAA